MKRQNENYGNFIQLSHLQAHPPKTIKPKKYRKWNYKKVKLRTKSPKQRCTDKDIFAVTARDPAVN